jgi:ribosomal protein S18 acetylase RimI-like enzyme
LREHLESTRQHTLDNPVWAALSGPHRRVAEIHRQAARYQPEVAPFVAMADDADETAWTDLAKLAGPGVRLRVTMGGGVPIPAGWRVQAQIAGVQLVDVGLEAVPDEEAQVLGPADVPEMLALVERTKPGPFRQRTIELGTYLGIRRDGALVAMAGERVHPPGWTEISAVCTDDAYRGQGLASRLIRAVAAGIRERGDVPFLHASAENTTAIRLYEALGFELRREVTFEAIEVPAQP